MPQGQTPANPPTPPVAHSSGPGPKPGKNVSPQPIGTGTPPTTTGSPGGKRSASRPRVEPAFPVKKGRKSDIISWPWAIITVLGLVLAYDVLTYWKEASSIETAGFGAATAMIQDLEGNTNAGGNPSASRTGRQPGS